MLNEPEDNWELVGNPDVYLDKLPQPYRFLNECLQDLIMKPVFEQITTIEERKKTPEYEGNIKEVQATGRLEIDGVTCMATLDRVTLAGGLSEKTNSAGSASYVASSSLLSKMLIGDKMGHVHLMDVSRKQMFDKKELPHYAGRRILSMSTACLEWLESRLVFVAVVARASPIVSILVFKDKENKLTHAYSLNMCPDLPAESIDELESVDGQNYAQLPAEVKLSPEFDFMAVTTFDGSVKLVKMPHVFDPLMLDSRFKGDDK